MKKVDSTTSSDLEEDQGAVGGLTTPANCKKRARVNIMTPSIAAVLDRTKLSGRKATFVLATVAQSLGHDVQELNINHSSIHRAREHYRADIASQLKQQFQGNVSLEV